jgi:hypothetical protein
MAKPPETTDPQNWHRFFGASANNAAWQFAEQAPETVNARELLNAAHTAAWHWEAVGTELNSMRARMLLAHAHAMAGLGRTALQFADEMRAYFLAAPDTPDWELAFVHVVHAAAAHAAGAIAEHAASYAKAQAALAAIADADDRAIVERVFRHVPAA